MKILTATQMREVDRRTTEQLGVPSLQLMENAGTGVVELLARECGLRPDRKIVILCGKGNNGGDGFVVARLLLKHGCRPEVFLFAERETVKGDAAVNLKRWQEAGGRVHTVKSEAEWTSARTQLSRAEIIVDALLGTGLTGPVEGLLAAVIADVNELVPSGVQGAGKRAKVVAVDIPSGLASDSGETLGPAIRADYTVTFTAPKLGQVLPENAELIGKLVIHPIGTPPEMLVKDQKLKLHWLEPGEFSGLLKRRKRDSHKGDFGHALIVAGSRGKSGAAALAAMGALRAGAGLATVATPESQLAVVASHMPEMMTEPLLGTEVESISVRNLDYGRFYELTRGKNVLAMGPGLSTHPETQQFVRRVLAECELPVILDADGLNAFAGRGAELREHKSALAVTPHPGEMARLMGCTAKEVQARRLDVALAAAAEWNAFVVLKGYRTIIAAPDGRAFINSTGNPGMATGGIGDVLTGMLAGMTAQYGVATWERVLAFGVYLHGLAGDLAAQQVGEPALIASDLVAAIPQACHSLLSKPYDD